MSDFATHSNSMEVERFSKDGTNPCSERPLCVDMDGTLLATDILWESLVLLVKMKPVLLLWLPFWLLKGKAFFKRQLAQHVTVNPSKLPYNDAVIALLNDASRA